MVQLLHKFSVGATESNGELLKVIKNPVTDHLPVGCRIISVSSSANVFKRPKELVPRDDPIVIVVDATEHGQVKTDYTKETIFINNRRLTSAGICDKLCGACEQVWGIL